MGDDGQLARPLTADESAFIRNERLLSAVDYLYWAERYSTLKLDGGGLGTLKFWESQRILLAIVAKAEVEMWEAADRGEPVDGILLCCHKARQLGLTAIMRSLTMHRMTLHHHQRALAGSVDEDKIQELYDRDKDILDNLPWWLRPTVGADEKRQHLSFERLGTRLLYQASAQKSGVGQGRQFELGHLTECASWLYPDTIEYDYFPTIPQSTNALVGLESTANGRGNWWHDFVNRVRAGHSRRWRFVFIPWYAEVSKYRAAPPDRWRPSEVSLLHAQMVYDSSPEFLGRHVMLSPQQLYWWESTRAEHLRASKLNIFLSNFCATVEESFQHAQVSVFSPETLEALRLHTAPGLPYELVTKEAA